MPTITSLLRQRVSLREYQATPVPPPVLDDILEAGRLSPSGGNEQPWRFGVITKKNVITQIASLARGQDWIAQSPLLIVLCTACVEDARGGRDIQLDRFPASAGAIAAVEQDLYWALNQEEHQTKIAGTHMVLAALEHGLASCWVSRFDVRAVTSLLHLPANIFASEILAFGYPLHQKQPTPKKSLAELVFWNTWEES